MLVSGINMQKNSQMGLPSCMGTMMKWVFKGFNKRLPLFVEKEPEVEIGCPTDVKHVAHIGWDGSGDNNAPSWMGEFKAGLDFTSSSIGHTEGSAISPWTSTEGKSKAPKKRRKKHRKSASTSTTASTSTSNSSPRNGGSGSGGSSRRKAKTRMTEGNNSKQT